MKVKITTISLNKKIEVGDIIRKIKLIGIGDEFCVGSINISINSNIDEYWEPIQILLSGVGKSNFYINELDNAFRKGIAFQPYHRPVLASYPKYESLPTISKEDVEYIISELNQGRDEVELEEIYYPPRTLTDQFVHGHYMKESHKLKLIDNNVVVVKKETVPIMGVTPILDMISETLKEQSREKNCETCGIKKCIAQGCCNANNYSNWIPNQTIQRVKNCTHCSCKNDNDIRACIGCEDYHLKQSKEKSCETCGIKKCIAQGCCNANNYSNWIPKPITQEQTKESSCRGSIDVNSSDRVFQYFENEYNSKTSNKLTITLEDYEGGYEEYGTITTVNGVELPFRNTDRRAILEGVLEHLGYKVEIIDK